VSIVLGGWRAWWFPPAIHLTLTGTHDLAEPARLIRQNLNQPLYLGNNLDIEVD
jgi:hypothetical protein